MFANDFLNKNLKAYYVIFLVLIIIMNNMNPLVNEILTKLLGLESFFDSLRKVLLKQLKILYMLRFNKPNCY